MSIYSKARRAVVELAKGIETAASLDYTAAAIHSRFKPAEPDSSALAR